MQLVIPVKALRSGGGGGLSDKGGTLTSPLILSRNPQELLEAATKSYVDNSITSIPATKIDSGTFSAERLPQFIGDAVKGVGSTQINLSNSGVTAGQYSKIGLNEKGQAIMGFPLTGDDIPSVTWSKFKTNIPTTLSGYGITNGLPKVGGTLTGYLMAVNAPTQSLHVANKAYVDGIFVNSGKPETGDILRSHVTSTPTGFLRCNGSEVSKTTYSALYNVIGDAFSSTTQPGSGKPWKLQYDITSAQSSDITGWKEVTSLPIAVADAGVVVTKNRVYLLGGTRSSGSSTSTVYTASIDSDGTLGAWTTGTPLPAILRASQAIVTKNRIYLLGGNYKSTVYTAPINADGTLGTWTTETALPGIVGASHAIVTSNRVYLLGGRTDPSTYISTVYTAPINADGTLGTWTTGTSLPNGIADAGVVVTKNRVYLLGGYSGGNSGGTISSQVYTAPINADGTLGAWTTGTSLPVVLSHSEVIVTKNRVYLLGGSSDTGNTSEIYTAPINADGTLGTWVTGTPLPVTTYNHQAIVTKNKIYLLAGYFNEAYSASVYTAPFSGGLNDYSSYYDGTITSAISSTFALPDYSSKETDGFSYFIKY